MHVFGVEGRKYTILRSFKLKQAVCQYFLRKGTKDLLLGTLGGDVYQASLEMSQIQSMPLLRYEESDKFMPEIVCMYERNEKLYLLNIES